MSEVVHQFVIVRFQILRTLDVVLKILGVVQGRLLEIEIGKQVGSELVPEHVLAVVEGRCLMALVLLRFEVLEYGEIGESY